MGLNIKKIAASVEKLAFDLASDLVQNAVYTQTTNPKYQASTGSQGTTGDPATKATANVSAMILQFAEKEIDGQQIQVGDERVLIRAVDMGPIKPNENDTMLGSDTLNRQVIAWTLDATQTLYSFQMRRIAT